MPKKTSAFILLAFLAANQFVAANEIYFGRTTPLETAETGGQPSQGGDIRMRTVGVLGASLATAYNFSNEPAFPAVVSDGASLTVEGNSPANNAIDSGETVTVAFRLKNTGNLATANVTATLVSGNGIEPITTASQNYGVLTANGSGVSRNFQFRVTGNAGATFNVLLAINNGSTPLGSVPFTFRIGPVGSDNAGNYSGGWGDGANGGHGFGPWKIESQQIASNSAAGAFIGPSTNAGITGLGDTAFGLYANQSNSWSEAWVKVTRPLATPLAVGQKLRFRWGINWDGDNGAFGNKGFNILVGTSEILNVNNAGNSTITVGVEDSGFGYGSQAMTWEFERTSATTLKVTGTDRDGTGTFTRTITVSNSAVDSIAFYASNMAPRPEREPYFNFFEILDGSPVTANAQIPSPALSKASAAPQISGSALLPASTGNIVLSQTAIAPVHSSPDGYTFFVRDALAAAATAIQGQGSIPTRVTGAAEYRYGDAQNGSTKLWKIKFDAVPSNPDDPDPVNFFPSRLDEAVTMARALIRANPELKGSESGYRYLYQAAYESIVPYTYAANEWRAKAERDRVNLTANPPKTIDDQLASLNTALGHYRTAMAGLLKFMNHPVESGYLIQPSAWIGAARPQWATANETWSDLLFESYQIALQAFADCGREYYFTRYLKEYRQPGEGSFNSANLSADITAFANEVDRLLLPISALRVKNVYPESRTDFYDPASSSNTLRKLADAVQERSLFFGAGAHTYAGSSTVRSATYGPNFVPFLTPVQLASRPFTFDNFLYIVYGFGNEVPIVSGNATISSLIGESISADASASLAIDQTVLSSQEFSNLRDQTRAKYEEQLGQLCGLRVEEIDNPASQLVPDLVGYLAPPGVRSVPNLAIGESDGDIALQWNRIEQAETRVLSAYRALAEIDEEAQLIRDFGNQRLLSYDRIAKIQLNTGEQISALDYLSGEIRAKALEDEAEERAKQAEKKSWFSAVAGIAVQGVLAYATAGQSLTVQAAAWGSLAASGGGLMDMFSKSKSEAEMHRNIGRIQADAARRQADIAAQQTRIRAMEGASITVEQAGQENSRIEESIQRLMIRVERQKLEILLAKQALDYAEIEHSNMVSRIGALISEYRKASVRQAASTLNRPDIRLRRDFEVQEASRKFRIAQEYSYLLAKAAEYRFRGKNDVYLAQINQRRNEILRAQRGRDLQTAVNGLITLRGQFLTATGGLSNLRQVRFSLRDFYAQSNSYYAVYGRDVFGNSVTLTPGDLQPFPMAAGQNATTVSDAQFTRFLTDSIVTEADGSKKLRISFSTGFERSYNERINTLRSETTNQYGHVIEGAGPSYVSSGACGVFLNIRMRSGTDVGMPRNAVLQPVGTFYTTTAGTGGEESVLPSNALAVWNPAELSSDGAFKADIQVLFNKDTVSTSNWRSSFNELTLSSAGSQLHERSPANDNWVLTIPLRQDQINQRLPLIRDIEVCMTIRGWGN
jgi:hypothetical protein